MTLGLKFLLCINGKVFDLKKNPFRYYVFSVAINVFLWDCGVKVFVSEGWEQAETAVQTL